MEGFSETLQLVVYVSIGIGIAGAAFSVASARFRQRIEEVSGTVAEVKSTATNSTTAMKLLEEKVISLEQSDNDKTIQIEKLTRDNNSLKTRVSHLEQENERKDKVITEVQAKLINANDEREKLRDRNTNLTSQMTEKDKEIIRLEVQVDALAEAKKEAHKNAIRMIEALSNIHHVVSISGADETPPTTPSPITPLAKYKDDDDSKDDDKQDVA